MSAMLNFENVELYYDRVYALKGVSLTLEAGETVALIGANGAGKSSILRAITGLAKLRSGQIHFMGQRLDAGALSTLARAICAASRHALRRRTTNDGDRARPDD